MKEKCLVTSKKLYKTSTMSKSPIIAFCKMRKVYILMARWLGSGLLKLYRMRKGNMLVPQHLVRKLSTL